MFQPIVVCNSGLSLMDTALKHRYLLNPLVNPEAAP